MTAMSACSVDTHYDSVSTYIDINVPAAAQTNEPTTIYQRFQFDRDLAPLQSMNLESAWISAPEVVLDTTNGDVAYNTDFRLDIVDKLSISIVESENETLIPWIHNDSSLKGEDVQLSDDKRIEDLRFYINIYQQLELQIQITLNPSLLNKYWRDVCDLSSDCTLRLPLSMYFKMEE